MSVEALALTEKDAHTLQVGKEHAMGKLAEIPSCSPIS